VEPKIRELEVKAKGEGEGVAERPDTIMEAAASRAAAEKAAADRAAADKAQGAEPAPPEVEEAPAEKAAEVRSEAEPEPQEKAEVKAEKAGTEKTEAPAEAAKAKRPDEKASSDERPTPTPAAEKRPAAKTADSEKTLAPRGLRKRARIISLPDEQTTPPPTQRPASPSRRPATAHAAPARRPPARGRGRRDTRKTFTPSTPTPDRAASTGRGRRRAEKRQEIRQAGDAPNALFRDGRPEGPITITQGMTVRDFAEKLGVKAKDLIKSLFSHGIMATINHQIDLETAEKLAADFGVEVMEVSFEEAIQLEHEEELEGDADKVPRAPVVTVMGHVDHGKTTLLDRIRETNVASGEAGGITQHIGAYHVDVDDRQIVFLDTPGHEAFTMMRARGAGVTDIVILVVAADDGVMPQTVEAINHAKAATVPIVVAINKIDKANANLDRVRKELSDHDLLVEDWGGETVSVPISALEGKGIDDLLEMVLINADLLELKASPTLPGRGVVLEARKEVGRGIVATVVIQEGTLKRSDVFVAGSTWGRVRTMTDDRGGRLPESGPATAVEITGFDDLPSAGDTLQVYENEGKVREIAEFRAEEERQRELAPKVGRVSLENLLDQLGKDEAKELPVIVKADVHGSIEVLKDSLPKLSTEKVQLNVIHASVGAISTNDVILASASNAIIVGFNVRPERNAAQLAEKEQVDVRLHTVIYELMDELESAMAGLLEPIFKEVQKGVAEVRDTFKVPKVGVVAGCHVTDGVIPRNAGVRLLRDNVVIYEGKLASLRRFKDDVSEVRQGFDCGIGLDSFQDVKPGDEIEAYVREEVAPSL
ncbi:MAG: translation initiation factor IF-2, partial [Holophagales bacterium]|nr:translation initiation factor IF-2 [Holophagales bacterium]